jgi:hypothetical protein
MSDDLARLLRWEDAGGAWRVLDRADDGLTIALLTCDGGTEMERFTSADPAVRDHVGDRDVS